jgi:UDP-glucose 4-epimerase|tara:strand:- start:1553 stop:2461 length:909 start_codon:yes stop_codon:yes gene_type:complete
MRILVTGGAGFVGTNLIKRLLKDGHEVVSVDNYTTGKKSNEQKGCEYHHRDLSNSQWWSLWDNCECQFSCDCQIEPVDIIFHLAALPRIVPSFKKPIDTFKSGPMATINVLDWARHHNTPVIYAGSSSVKGDVYANPYTFTKWQNEHLLELYNKVFNVPTSICRFYNVYGEHQANEGSYCNVLGIFQRKFFDDEPLTITGDGEQRRDFTYVGDIVDGLVRCGKALFMAEINGESFELGNGKNYSVNEVANAFGEDYPKEHIDARPGEVRESLNEDRKAREVLGWNPKGDIVKFVKENYVLKK